MDKYTKGRRKERKKKTNMKQDVLDRRNVKIINNTIHFTQEKKDLRETECQIRSYIPCNTGNISLITE
jgi:hypothetical protein